MANRSLGSVLDKSEQETQQSTSLTSKENLFERLKRGANVRARFVDSNLSKIVAFQIRALREKEGWTQQRLAEKIESNQNAIYRAENLNYGKHTVTTLRKIAAAFDVALIVRFVPFSELTDWVNGTPHVVQGLSSASFAVPTFSDELATLERRQEAVEQQDAGPQALSRYASINTSGTTNGSAQSLGDGFTHLVSAPQKLRAENAEPTSQSERAAA